MSLKNPENKLGLLALISMCVGSMIGAGLFALPQNVAVTTGVAALLIGWVITFLGMICLVRVFQNLAIRCPHLDVGIYAYAREGLGDYCGFNSAWGYWISVWLGNIGYVIALCAALSFFFPLFGDGTTWQSLVLGSVIIWGITYLCLCGMRSATVINTVVTLTKILPIIVFIAIIAYAFNHELFTADIWQTSKLGSLASQIKKMMLVTVWLFIGIEGASVFSSRAKNRKDIGTATLISFLVMFVILFAISILPFGILTQEKIAVLTTPSTGALLASVIGGWGNAFMNFGLIISVLGAFLSWILIAAEVPYVASKRDQLFPKLFVIENKVHSPAGALVVTAICQQIYLFVAYFYKAGYLVTISLAATMVLLPYLLAALYALVLVISGRTYEKTTRVERRKDLLISVVAVIYGIWLLYAAGKYLLLSSILYFIGSIVYIANKRWRRQAIFKRHEKILFLLLGVVSVACVIVLVLGKAK